MVQSKVNALFKRLTIFLSNNIPGLVLLIWTLLVIVVGLDSIASVSHMLWWYYPIYSIIVWIIIGAFAQDKVWQTIKIGLVGHIILFVCILLILSTFEGGSHFVFGFVAVLAWLAIVSLFALSGSVVILISSWITNSIRHWFTNRVQQQRTRLFYLLAIVTGVGVFAFFLISPKITPASRLKAEQEIYSLLLTDRRIGGEKANPISQYTTLGEFEGITSERSIKLIVDGLPTLQQETLSDFHQNNKVTYLIKNVLPPTNRAPLINPKDGQQIWWVSFSRIGLNSRVTQALVLVEVHAACKNGVCEYGTGNIILLQKIMGKWVILKRLETWHMHPT